MTDYDVIVIGAGGAGLSAALSAAERGARVLIAESEDRVGGSTRLSDAWLQAAGTSVQRRDGVEDNPERMFRYYMGVNRWQVEPGLARAYCDDGPGLIDWLIGLGLEFGPIDFVGNEELPRGHPTIGMGEALVDTVVHACTARDVDIALGNRVERLLVEGGRIVGVQARGESATARSVVVASGGFAHNPELIRRFLGGRLLAGDHPATPAAPGSRGDALVLGEQVGAGIVGHNRGHWVPFPFFPAEAVLVTIAGRRFVNEAVDHSVRTMVANYHGHTYVAIFDERIRRLGGSHPFVNRTPAALFFRDEEFDPHGPPVDGWIADGTLTSALSIEGVAQGAGLHPAAVARTIEQYNSHCALGADRDFEKDARLLVPVCVPPYYALRIAPRSLVATFCGLAIDPDARVLDTSGAPLPGLYAAGEAAGGVVGEVYVGHGNSVTTALIFGRRAGAAAARWAMIDKES